MKGVEVLDGLHLLLRFQILEDPPGGDHVVQIDARNYNPHHVFSATTVARQIHGCARSVPADPDAG